MEKNIKPEGGREEKERLLQPYEISGKLFDSFKNREDVKNWIKNKDLGLVSQEFVATIKKTLDTVSAIDGKDTAKEVAKYIQDDMEFGTCVFGDPEKETAFKAQADNYLNETYLKPEEQVTAPIETQAEGK
jgi:hypothetical protein